MEFKNEHVACSVQPEGHLLHITGNVLNPSLYSRINLCAANPIDRMTSYSGSGMPFPCPNIAFDNSPNTYEIDTTGAFSTTFVYPNSYYTNDAMEKVPPSIFFILYKNNGEDNVYVRFGLEDPLPVRTLTHRAGRVGPEFYTLKDELIAPQTAEGVMRSLKALKYKYALA